MKENMVRKNQSDLKEAAEGVGLKRDIKAVRTLLTSADYGKAREFCEKLNRDYPQAWQPHAVMAQVAEKKSDLPSLQSCLKGLAETNAPEGAVYKVRYQIAVLENRDKDELASLKKLTALFPGVQKWARLHLAQLVKLTKSDDFFSALKAALIHHPDMSIPYPWLRQMKSNFPSDEFHASLTESLSAASGSASLYLARAVTSFDLNDKNGFWGDLKAVYKLDSNFPLPKSVVKTIQTLVALDEASRDELYKLHKTHPKSRQVFWLYAMILDQRGEHIRYRDLILSNWNWVSTHNAPLKASIIALVETGRLDDVTRKDARTQYFCYLLANQIPKAIEVATSDSDIDLLQQIQSIQKKSDDIDYKTYWNSVTISGPERPNGTVLVFGGLGDMFCLPANTLDHAFAALGLTAIYFKDFSRLIYLNGINEIGENYDETLDWIRKKLSTLGKTGQPLFTHGNSAGGLAAMIYGVDLGANASLVYSPPSAFAGDIMEEIGDRRGKIVGKRVAKELDVKRFDLNKVLSRASDNYKVTAYAASGSKIDFSHAKYLKNMPRTSVKILDDADQHSILALVAQKYGLLNTIRKAYGLS